jgi:hypothetical protein
MVVGCVVKHDQQLLAWVGPSFFWSNCATRSASHDSRPSKLNRSRSSGEDGPKHVEALKDRVGLELDHLPTLDPALARYSGVEQVRGIEKVDLASTRQCPFFAV